MARAPRRHPATAALADLRHWRDRWSATIEDLEHITAVEAWVRRTAKAVPARGPKASARPIAAKPAAKGGQKRAAPPSA